MSSVSHVTFTIRGKNSDFVQHAIEEEISKGNIPVRGVHMTCIDGVLEKEDPIVTVVGDDTGEVIKAIELLNDKGRFIPKIKIVSKKCDKFSSDIFGNDPYKPGFRYPNVTFPKIGT